MLLLLVQEVLKNGMMLLHMPILKQLRRSLTKEPIRVVMHLAINHLLLQRKKLLGIARIHLLESKLWSRREPEAGF